MESPTWKPWNCCSCGPALPQRHAPPSPSARAKQLREPQPRGHLAARPEHMQGMKGAGGWGWARIFHFLACPTLWLCSVQAAARSCPRGG